MINQTLLEHIWYEQKTQGSIHQRTNIICNHIKFTISIRIWSILCKTYRITKGRIIYLYPFPFPFRLVFLLCPYFPRLFLTWIYVCPLPMESFVLPHATKSSAWSLLSFLSFSTRLQEGMIWRLPYQSHLSHLSQLVQKKGWCDFFHVNLIFLIKESRYQVFQWQWRLNNNNNFWSSSSRLTLIFNILQIILLKSKRL